MSPDLARLLASFYVVLYNTDCFRVLKSNLGFQDHFINLSVISYDVYVYKIDCFLQFWLHAFNGIDVIGAKHNISLNSLFCLHLLFKVHGVFYHNSSV